MDMENFPVSGSPSGQTNPQNHPDKNSKNKWIIIGLLVVILSYSAGYKTGIKGLVFEPKEFKIVNQQNQPKDVDYQTLWDAIKVVQEKYIGDKPNPQDFLNGAVKGAVESTGDPYTTYFAPKVLDDFQTNLKGSFEGIGAEIGKQGNNIVIVAPLDDSPAKKAGLLAKDIIYKVNGETVENWSVEQTVDKIRGKKGTEVVLTIVREGKPEPFDVKIIRDTIKIKSIKWEIKEADKDGSKVKVGIITLSQFGDDTKDLFNQAVNQMLSQNVQKIVLDERNNPGGYLQTAVDLASAWLESGTLVVSEVRNECSTGAIVGADCGTQKYLAQASSRLKGIKTVILINGGSASAAEILAGALRDNNAAKLIGEKSFGKGSVQELVDLKEGGAVKVTIAKWVTPSGKNLNRDGLVPDIEVKLSEQDIKDNKDPQMEKAIEEVMK